nr:uncharacterized protein LOC129445277 [Misgurnus anguillicaudatus]
MSLNAAAPNATAPNATAPNATAPNATAPNATAPNATAPNATAPNATAPNATASANSTTPVDINLSFSIVDTFKAVYSNMSAPETLSLIKNITTQIEPVYKKRFSKFLRMVIKKFRSGSIVVDSALQFDSNGTTPNATDVKRVLIDALANGNLTIKISNDTINVTAPATPGQCFSPKCNGPKCNGSKCNGPKCNGPKCNGPKCNGPKCNSSKCNGSKCNGPKCNGSKCNSICQ